MTKREFTHNCFICKYSDWSYHSDIDIPIVRELHCKKGHEQTSYNTNYDEDFVCEDYKHSYFTKSYFGIWFWLIYFGFLLFVLLLSFGGSI